MALEILRLHAGSVREAAGEVRLAVPTAAE